jgi:RNA polymerase sigma factor (sigma-70 family)
MARVTAEMEEPRSSEGRAEAAWHAQDYKTTATIVLEAYGAEIYSFILAQFHGNRDQADDVFAGFREDFWRGLPKFQWRCSIRAWGYRLARNAGSRFRRAPQNRRARHVRLSEVSFLDELTERARTTTMPHLRSEVKDEFQRLREQLSEEERDLLVLRVDRDLAWRDVAYAMLPAGEPADDDRIRKLEGTLRQRFVDVKRRLKLFAKEAGIL